MSDFGSSLDGFLTAFFDFLTQLLETIFGSLAGFFAGLFG